MNSYLERDVFSPPQKEFIYIERKTSYNRVRRGLLALADLETYEWKPFSKSLIRATEATIIERIPPRKEIRKKATLETPHIMLLVDDISDNFIKTAQTYAKQNAPVYDGFLMQNGGHITGYAIKEEKAFNALYDALSAIKKAHTLSDGSSFMFAVGDGNHSLATAKSVWEDVKKDSSAPSAAARYALVEIVNIYDSGLTFEPIHRVLFSKTLSDNSKDFINFICSKLGGKAKNCSSKEEIENLVKKSKSGFGFIYKIKEESNYIFVDTDISGLLVSYLQPALDEYIALSKKNGINIDIDYIHGTSEVFRLGGTEGSIALLLPPIAKDSFFNTINSLGPLPRKSFSMGEADEKRFYLECRKL